MAKRPSARGGRREGAGRPPTGVAMSAGVFIRTSEEQKAALVEFLEALNIRRAKRKLPRVELSTWAREVLLKHSGNERLGAAAKARAEAAAAADIV